MHVANSSSGDKNEIILQLNSNIPRSEYMCMETE